MISSGFISNSFGNFQNVVLKRTLQDFDNNKTRSVYQSFMLDTSSKSVFPMPVPSIELNTVALYTHPDGQHILKMIQQKDGEKKQSYVELWRNGGLIRNFPVNELHGDFVADSWFGNCSWGDGFKVVYVAQKKEVTASTYYDIKGKNQGKKYEFQENWGEKYEKIVDLVLVLLDLETGKGQVIDGIPEHITPGQPIFTPDGKWIVYTGWNHQARKLGMIYCYQRPCNLYAFEVEPILQVMKDIVNFDNQDKKENEQETKQELLQPSEKTIHYCLTPNLSLARSPRFDLEGKNLIFLGSRGFSTHNGCMRLENIAFDEFLKNKTEIPSSRIIVDEVRTPSSLPSQGGFPGIWCDQLPTNCWSSDSQFVWFSSAWGSRKALLRVNVKTGEVLRVVDAAVSVVNDPDADTNILGVFNDIILFEASTPSNPGSFGIMFVSNDSNNFTVINGPEFDATVCSSVTFNRNLITAASDKTKQIQSRIIDVIPNDGGHNFECIFMKPKIEGTNDGKLPPLIVCPHGGPHSIMTMSFIAPYAYLCAEGGFALLHVNYRGSTGFGSDNLVSLAGKIGFQDVSDVRDSVNAVRSEVDMNRIGVCGGSHGGFLSAHMIGQYPEIFKAAVLRNPVTNIPSMVGVSDIPDWCFVETLGPDGYDFSKTTPAGCEQLTKMWLASPVVHIEKIRAPTLILLGGVDRRVPPSQGFEFYHALRTRGIKAKLFVYPEDCHAIDIPSSAADHWINIFDWMQENLANI